MFSLDVGFVSARFNRLAFLFELMFGGTKKYCIFEKTF